MTGDQRGITYVDVMIAGLMIVVSLVLLSKLLVGPVEDTQTLSPKAEAQQITRELVEDQVEQWRGVAQPADVFHGTLVTTPAAPGVYGYYLPITAKSVPAGTDSAYHVSIIDETALVRHANANDTYGLLGSCANIATYLPIKFDVGSSFTDSSIVEFATPQTIVKTAPATAVPSPSCCWPCQVSFTANIGQFAYAHVTGTPVVPVNPQHVTPQNTTSSTLTAFHQYLTALVTIPQLGGKLVTASAVGASRIVVSDGSDIKVGSYLRIDSNASSELRQVSAISGVSVTLSAALANSHAAGTWVAVTSYLTDTYVSPGDDPGNQCIKVADPTLFVANMAVQIGSGSTLDSEVVGCVGAGCSCIRNDPTQGRIYGTATANTIALVRPVHQFHVSGVAVAPAIYSTSSFNIMGAPTTSAAATAPPRLGI